MLSSISNPNLERQLKSTILYQALEKCKSVFWFLFWFSSGINLLVLFLPIYTSQVLDRVLSSGSTATLIMLTVITLASFLCSALLDISRSLTTVKVGDWLDDTLAPELVKKAIALISIRPGTSSGEAVRDMQIIKNFLIGQGLFAFFDAPWSILYLVAIFMINPFIGYIAVIGIVVLVLIALLNDYSTRRLAKQSNEENVRNINEIEIATRNSEVVEAMGMMDYIVDKWNKKNISMRKTQTLAVSRSYVIMAFTKAIRFTLQISVIGVGAYLALSGQKTAGGIIAASILMGRTLAPFEMAIANWKNLSQAKMSYQRLQILLLSAPTRTEAMELPNPVGHIEFDKVMYTPIGSNKPTIKGISFEIPAGKVVGVIGNSAAGKSTIARLMVGVLKPISGVVRLDGADTYTWNRQHFGKYVGYLPQDIELFNTTIKENISRFDPDMKPEDVVKAAKIAGVHEMVLRFPDGYDTMIGAGGSVLSGGQRQRIGIARAFYGDIKLLVLDEPNANLDSSGEMFLINALLYAKKSAITTFIMTHKFSLLNSVDIIMVIKDGMVVMLGDRDEVLNQIMQQQNAEKQNKNTQQQEKIDEA
jgi:ATP-binding cassette subfamily B protein